MEVMAIVRRRTETFSDEQFAPMLEPEAETIRRLYIEGVVRAIWSRNDALGAVVVLEADSLDAAREIVAAFPLVKSDMAEVEMLIPMRGYRGFAPRSN
jgi:muconolactone delta-isomerase